MVLDLLISQLTGGVADRFILWWVVDDLGRKLGNRGQFLASDNSAQLFRQRGCRWSTLRVLRHCKLDGARYGVRNPLCAEVGKRITGNSVHQRQQIGIPIRITKRRFAAHEMEQRCAKTVDIRGRPNFGPEDGFRGDVPRGKTDRVGLTGGCTADGANPKVGDEVLAVRRDKNVCRLQVPMDNTEFVSLGNRIGNFGQNLASVDGVELPALFQLVQK